MCLININSNLDSKINSDHFLIVSDLTLPTESSGMIRDADSNLLGYFPIGTCALTTYNQNRTNQFDAALDTTNGTLYAINVPSSLFGQPCIVLCVKNEIFF